MIRGDWNSDSVAEIDLLAGNDTSNKDNGKIAFKTQANNAGGLEHRMLINEDGQILIGGTSNAAAPNTNERLILFGNAANNSRIAIVAQHNDDNPGTIIIAKSRSTGNSILGNNDDVGQLDFAGNDGNGYHVMARIMCSAQGHDTSNDDLPAKLRFFTLTENSTTIRERLTIDDEGVPSQKNLLIEDGILVKYMQDTQNAYLMNVEPTGNGRRQSFAHCPMQRMTNTYLDNGSFSSKEIIESVDKGIYAVNFGGGQVDITSGDFVFSSSEAYMIENGKIKYPIKGATLIGNGANAMHKIKMIGNDLKLDEGIGTCGKDGQGVPVGVGQPTLLMDGITIGGTNI